MSEQQPQHQRTTVKLTLADETHRVTLDTATLSLDALRALVLHTFAAASHRTWTLVYTDNEGDIVTISSPSELDEARRVLLGANADPMRSPRTLHLRVMPTVGFAEQLAPAMRHAVEEFAGAIHRLASGSRESFSHSSVYLERGRASVVQSASKTRELLDAARREVAQRLRDVHARIAGEIERRRSRTASASTDAVTSNVRPSSTDDDEGIANTSGADTAPAASELLLDTDSECANDDSEEEEKEDESESENDASDATNDAVELPDAAIAAVRVDAEVEEIAAAAAAMNDQNDANAAAAAAMDASDAETIASDSDDFTDLDDACDDDADAFDMVAADDWRIVVPDDYAADVALIQSILPHVHVDDCVMMLQRHNGNLEAALDELTDA